MVNLVRHRATPSCPSRPTSFHTLLTVLATFSNQHHSLAAGPFPSPSPSPSLFRISLSSSTALFFSITYAVPHAIAAAVPPEIPCTTANAAPPAPALVSPAKMLPAATFPMPAWTPAAKLPVVSQHLILLLQKRVRESSIPAATPPAVNPAAPRANGAATNPTTGAAATPATVLGFFTAQFFAPTAARVTFLADVGMKDIAWG